MYLGLYIINLIFFHYFYLVKTKGTSHMELTHAAMENHTIQEMLFAVVIKFIM